MDVEKQFEYLRHKIAKTNNEKFSLCPKCDKEYLMFYGDYAICLNCGTRTHTETLESVLGKGVIISSKGNNHIVSPILETWEYTKNALLDCCYGGLNCSYKALDSCICHQLKDDGTEVTLDFKDML